uniref:Uncharacterized protein n=1 Tax=Glossina pallidipes TaxID=7398 RepID=A0A1B0A7T5_GLOPL
MKTKKCLSNKARKGQYERISKLVKSEISLFPEIGVHGECMYERCPYTSVEFSSVQLLVKYGLVYSSTLF